MPRPYRFIPSAVLLHFASTVAPARTCRPRFLAGRGPQARQRDISRRRNTSRRHAQHERTRRCLWERRIRDPYPDTMHPLACLGEYSSHNSQTVPLRAGKGPRLRCLSDRLYRRAAWIPGSGLACRGLELTSFLSSVGAPAKPGRLTRPVTGGQHQARSRPGYGGAPSS